MGRMFNKGRKSANEFDEIKALSLGAEKVISKDDMVDFQIDFGLYNQKAQRELKKELKAKIKSDVPKNKGKKKCAIRKSGGSKKSKTGRKARKVVEKCSSFCEHTKENLESGILITR